MRHLATVQRIVDLQPIEGKDRIELAQVLGWHVIVQKDQFKVGDLCVYCEIDSVMPETPEFEFLRSRKFRVRTIKMGGAISQGLVLPLSILPAREADYFEEEDVTDIIGVNKYEPNEVEEEKKPEPKKKKNFLMRFKWFRNLFPKPGYYDSAFPSFVSKTDEVRIQAEPWRLIDNDPYVVTEKVDGTSGTFALVKHKNIFGVVTYDYYVCSRNKRLRLHDDDVYNSVSDRYDIMNVLKSIMDLDEKNTFAVIQGEIIAPKVQKNKYNKRKPDLYVFNVITSDHGRYSSITAKNIIEKHGMKFVPIVDSNFFLPGNVDDMVAYAHGKSMITDIYREGVVVRSMDGQKSFKAVDPEFLLGWKE